MAYEVALGRTQLARLAGQSRFAVADSAFNESELHALGYEGTAVVPLLIDMAAKSDEPDPALAALLCERKAREGARICCTWGRSRRTRRRTTSSRCSTCSGASTTRRRDCTWWAPRSARRYEPALRAFVAELGLGDAVNLAGSVTGAELEAYYRARRRVRDRVGPRGVLRAAGRGHGPRACRSWPTA